MNLARVVGRVVATCKQESLSGRKLLVLKPLNSDLSDSAALPFIAVDAVGSGAGEVVLYVKGREAAHAFLPDEVVTDAGIIGIVDSATLER